MESEVFIMFCNKCGNPNPDDSRFCSRCGAPLWAPEPAPFAPVVPPVEPVKPQVEWTPAPNAPVVFPDPVETTAFMPETAPLPETDVPAEPLPEDTLVMPAFPAEETPAAPIFPEEPTLDPIFPPEEAQPEAPAAPQYVPPAPPQYAPPARPTQPVPPRYAPPVPPQAPPAKPGKERKSRPAPSGGTKAATVILCLFFALFFLYASTVGMLRCTLNEDTYASVLKDTDFRRASVEVDGEEYDFAEYLWNVMPAPLTYAFSGKDLQNILDSDEAKEAVAHALAGYTDYFVANKPVIPLTAEDIVDFFDDNRELASNIYGNGISREGLLSYLDASFDFDNIRSAARLERFLDADFGMTRFALSPLGYGLSIFLCVLMLALILIVNRANIPACLPAIFVTILVLGCLYLPVALALCVVSLFVSAPIVELLSALLLHFAVLFALRGGIAFVVGLAGLLISRACKKRHTAEA